MRPINEAHVAQPGLAVVEVAAADDQTAFAIQEALAGRWATGSADRTTRAPGEPGDGCAATWTCARTSTPSPTPGAVFRAGWGHLAAAVYRAFRAISMQESSGPCAVMLERCAELSKSMV
ncbi:DUF6207 family protein [Streptomyces violaceus]|uniref:DUF6207 family protein n=1 Tax=Streptomyces violaceus TaxID=1936 RepID=UPI003809D2AC